LQHHRGRIEILRNVIETKENIDCTRTEDALRSQNLTVKKFVADRRRVALVRSDGAADAGEKNFSVHKFWSHGFFIKMETLLCGSKRGEIRRSQSGCIKQTTK
jgi:hypothetical protein